MSYRAYIYDIRHRQMGMIEDSSIRSLRMKAIRKWRPTLLAGGYVEFFDTKGIRMWTIDYDRVFEEFVQRSMTDSRVITVRGIYADGSLGKILDKERLRSAPKPLTPPIRSRNPVLNPLTIENPRLRIYDLNSD